MKRINRRVQTPWMKRRKVRLCPLLCLALGMIEGGGLPALARITQIQPQAAVQSAELIVVGIWKDEGGVTPEPKKWVRAPLAIQEVLRGTPRANVVDLEISSMYGVPGPSPTPQLFFLRWDEQSQAYTSVVTDAVLATGNKFVSVENDLEVQIKTIRQLIYTSYMSGDLGFVWKPDTAKLVVASVKPSSAAAHAKVLVGDVIVHLERMAVTTPQAFTAAVLSHIAGARLALVVDRPLPVETMTTRLTLWLTVPPEASRGSNRDRLLLDAATGAILEVARLRGTK